MSQNAGGLIRWPVLGWCRWASAILLVQAVSELIKRIAFITGHLSEPFSGEAEKSTKNEPGRRTRRKAARRKTRLRAN
jgi:TRAP-type mannitol/chloroaromatic compound transport system permease small subunit